MTDARKCHFLLISLQTLALEGESDAFEPVARLSALPGMSEKYPAIY